jgi:hypothetical protein
MVDGVGVNFVLKMVDRAEVVGIILCFGDNNGSMRLL